jgi:hypothetical protein
MNHEEALTRVLAGGPIPIEAEQHLASCPECREELKALRNLEAEIKAAAPEWKPSRTFEETALASLSRTRTLSWRRWLPVAASILLLLGLVGSWMDLPRHGSSAAEMEMVLSGESLDGQFWYDAWEEGTGGLLDTAGEWAEDIPENPPEDLDLYLDPYANGEWDG